MNKLGSFVAFMAPWFFFAFIVSQASIDTPTVPAERDRQVLESLLLHLLADNNFEMTQVSLRRKTIFLHARTPEKTGFVSHDQMQSELGSRRLPEGAEKSMRCRNTPYHTRPDKYEAVTAFYTNLEFAEPIIVADLTELWSLQYTSRSFEDVYPNACGWLEAYLPGYSNDGKHAVVRAGVGPDAHAAMLTAVLKKQDNKWVVTWYHLVRFA